MCVCVCEWVPNMVQVATEWHEIRVSLRNVRNLKWIILWAVSSNIHNSTGQSACPVAIVFRRLLWVNSRLSNLFSDSTTSVVLLVRGSAIISHKCDRKWNNLWYCMWEFWRSGDTSMHLARDFRLQFYKRKYINVHVQQLQANRQWRKINY